MGSLSRVTNDGIPLDVAEIIIHPDYKTKPNEQNDVALIRLVDPVILSPTIRTVCLPDDVSQFEVDQNQAWYKAGRWSVVTGWGDINVRRPTDYEVILQEKLKFTAMRVQTDQTCDVIKINPLLIYNQGMYCAGDGKYRDACTGDSGGPAVVELPVSYRSKRVFQIGIVSWGFGCRQAGKYGYYVRLEKFLPWILDKVDPPQP